ncbi:hypothetical protein ACFONI_10020 [Aeromonas media]
MARLWEMAGPVSASPPGALSIEMTIDGRSHRRTGGHATWPPSGALP